MVSAIHILTYFILKKNKTHKEDTTIIFYTEGNWDKAKFSNWYNLVNIPDTHACVHCISLPL